MCDQLLFVFILQAADLRRLARQHGFVVPPLTISEPVKDLGEDQVCVVILLDA